MWGSGGYNLNSEIRHLLAAINLNFSTMYSLITSHTPLSQLETTLINCNCHYQNILIFHNRAR